MAGKRTKSGVFVADDFRNNLIIDRYDPVFAAMRGDKIQHLASENSEDALTWNVFRSLRQIAPAFWFPRLFASVFGHELQTQRQLVSVHLWPTVSPPPAIRLFQKEEGESEIDIAIETEYEAWFIEAKYKSDVSQRTTNNPKRDQILRNIDVGSWYAGARDFYFSLLILDGKHSPVGVSLIDRYTASKDSILAQLPHRPDGLTNLKGVGILRWADLAAVLSECARLAPLEDERAFAKRAVEWLQTTGIGVMQERRELAQGTYEQGTEKDEKAMFERDVEWFDQHRRELVSQYQDQYVAVLNGAVVDHDPGFEKLAERIYAKYGYRDFVMQKVKANAEPYRIVSPKLVSP